MRIIFGIVFLGLLLGFGCIDTQPVACTLDAKMCPDGSYVGRIAPDCEFAPCPEMKSCDAVTPCSEGYECYSFEDSGGPVCYTGDPCFRCPSGKCVILESYPMQVRCEGETGAPCEDLCGDGICQEIVCEAIGCPCAETPESCPQDCAGADTEQCSSYGTEDCPETCQVCPPCPECSSLACQDEKTCEGMGFDREWSETVTTQAPETVEVTNEIGLQYCDVSQCPEGYSCRLLQKEERPTCLRSDDIYNACEMCSSGKCYMYSYSPIAIKCIAEGQ